VSFLVVSPSVSKLREFEKIKAVNTFETASTVLRHHTIDVRSGNFLNVDVCFDMDIILGIAWEPAMSADRRGNKAKVTARTLLRLQISMAGEYYFQTFGLIYICFWH